MLVVDEPMLLWLALTRLAWSEEQHRTILDTVRLFGEKTRRAEALRGFPKANSGHDCPALATLISLRHALQATALRACQRVRTKGSVSHWPLAATRLATFACVRAFPGMLTLVQCWSWTKAAVRQLPAMICEHDDKDCTPGMRVLYISKSNYTIANGPQIPSPLGQIP